MVHHHLPVTERTVHWGYFSKAVAPTLTLRSGDTTTIETLTRHAADDYDRMIRGDAAAERIYHWTATEKTIARRRAGRASAHRAGGGRRSGTGRRAGGAHP